ncbi:YopX family protein [Streptococcus suis]|uniref:YopX family protein n=1 Tax=Streptococcus suis TaxID=1307 RepID=UPI001C980FF1|nr:YopX family protein [Streptococcus suis]MBY5009426.1 YopX family protein [Streptococcus suis]MDG4519500.1 YopX family protein [Streptococcus suis]
MIPKFRAWNTFHNKWVKHFYITENGLIYNMEQPHRDLIGAVPIEQSGLIVMQSTGLFDVNGKEIFEGDVVRMHSGELLPVRLHHGMFEPVCYCVSSVFEKVGNIFENPELTEHPDFREATND